VLEMLSFCLYQDNTQAPAPTTSLLKEETDRKTDCTLKANQIKLLQSFNILLQNPSHTLRRRQELQVSRSLHFLKETGMGM
jgi:hypothetical protein